MTMTRTAISNNKERTSGGNGEKGWRRQQQEGLAAMMTRRADSNDKEDEGVTILESRRHTRMRSRQGREHIGRVLRRKMRWESDKEVNT